MLMEFDTFDIESIARFFISLSSRSFLHFLQLGHLFPLLQSFQRKSGLNCLQLENYEKGIQVDVDIDIVAP